MSWGLGMGRKHEGRPMVWETREVCEFAFGIPSPPTHTYTASARHTHHIPTTHSHTHIPCRARKWSTWTAIPISATRSSTSTANANARPDASRGATSAFHSTPSIPTRTLAAAGVRLALVGHVTGRTRGQRVERQTLRPNVSPWGGTRVLVSTWARRLERSAQSGLVGLNAGPYANPLAQRRLEPPREWSKDQTLGRWTQRRVERPHARSIDPTSARKTPHEVERCHPRSKDPT
jgi:hypothetical protein